MTQYSQHHSFDIHLAAKYGIEEAILIHHFQHWCAFNATNGVNFHEDRTWTYQTRNDIASRFPYLSPDKVRRITDSLVNQGVIRKGNFNKMKMDKTCWYAFEDEKMFMIGENAHRADEKHHRVDDFATPIPDTKSKDAKDKDNISLKVPKGTDEEKDFSKEISKETKDVANAMLNAILAVKPDFIIKASSKANFLKSVDLLLRVDKRDPKQAMQVLEASLKDNFWRDKFFKPNPAKYLRDKYDQLYVKFFSPKNTDGDQNLSQQEKWTKENTKKFYEWKKENPSELKHCYIKNGYLKNTENEREARVNLEPQAFLRLFIDIAGVKIED